MTKDTKVQSGLIYDPQEARLGAADRWQVLRDLTEQEYDALKHGIAEDGVVSSIVFDASGNVIDGHHRLRAWKELIAEGVSVPPVPYQRRLDMTEAAEIRLLARKLNLQRRQLTQAEKREVVKEQLKETPERTDLWLAEDMGVNDKTVTNYRLAAATSETATSPDPNLLPERVLGRDGRWVIYQTRKNLIEKLERKAAAKPDKGTKEGGEDQDGDQGQGESSEATKRATDPAQRTTTEQDVEGKQLPDPPELSEAERHFYRISEYFSSLSQMDPLKMAEVPQDGDEAYSARRTAEDVIEWFSDFKAALLERERGQLRLVGGKE